MAETYVAEANVAEANVAEAIDYFAHNLTFMGNIVSVDPAKYTFTIQLPNDQKQLIHVGVATEFKIIKNLDNLDLDRVPDPERREGENPLSFSIRKYLKLNCLIVTNGVYQHHKGDSRYQALTVHLMYLEKPENYRFEETHWWLTQISRLADQWLDQLFDDRRDYTIADFVQLYTTNLNIIGLPTDNSIQETATLSRLIYGLSSAFLLTGVERYLEAARAGVRFQRETFRHLSHDGQYCFWAFGRKRLQYSTQIYETSLSGDDANTIPLYEQIYALAGLTQYYRITLDPQVLKDIQRTVAAFNDFYLHKKRKDPQNPNAELVPDGYFSHLDYATMKPDVDALGINKAKKNWNSVGDHLPAYLINLILALEPLPQNGETQQLQQFLTTCKWMLEHTSDLICQHFPDPDPTIPFVNERFTADWTPDHSYSWQQNRGIVGHNLKIAWNLTRVANYFQTLAASESDGEKYREKAKNYLKLANKLADSMAVVGLDRVRGGCFDALERQPQNGMPLEFAWSSTKDFWQQEQGILAYLILYGATHMQKHKDLARQMMAFWNLFFLDRDHNGIHFRVSDDGIPITTGEYGVKGGHAVSGYHAFELNFLAHLYIRTFVRGSDKQNDADFVLYFKPDKDCGQSTLNVLPDFFPPGFLSLKKASIGDAHQTVEVSEDFQIPLSPAQLGRTIYVEFESRRPE